MTSLQEFLAMGGHGLFVWASYGLALVLLLLNILLPLRRDAQLRRELRAEMRQRRSPS